MERGINLLADLVKQASKGFFHLPAKPQATELFPCIMYYYPKQAAALLDLNVYQFLKPGLRKKDKCWLFIEKVDNKKSI
jgi:hypothetical protein